MKKSIIYLFLFMSTSLFAQTYYAPTTGVLSSYSGGCPIGVNTGTFVDDGGVSSNYSSNITDIYQTICPTVAGESIQLTFTLFNMENNVDYIKIANGPAQNSSVFTSAPADAFGWITGNLGAIVPFSYTATNSSGCLTVRTYTDGGTQRAGFVATISTVNNGTALSSGNSDCSNSTFICSNTSFNDVSYGPGLSPNDACGNSSCLTGEVYSNWYTFTAKTTGTLTLNIAPNTPTDDFDFALYGPNVACGAAVAPIRCSFAGVSGSTGLSNTAFDASEDVSGDSYVSQLNVIAGETYKLMVNNWSPGGAGFNMTFGGTATLGTNPPSVNSVANCGAQSTTLTATPDVLGGAYLWNTGATTPSITVSPSSTTSYSCVYTINSCSSVTSGSGTITVTPTPTATISYSGSPFCTSLGAQAVNLSGTNSYTGGTFSSAGGLSINSTTGLITPSSSTSGPYTVTYAIPAVGACPSTNATTSITIDGTPSAIAGGSQSICAGSTALVSGASSANGTIAWTHNGNGTITNPTSLTPTYNSTLADAGNTVTLTMTVTSNNSCGGTATASYAVVVNAIPTVTNATLTQAICSGSNATFIPTSAVASSTYAWTASLTSGTVTGFSASGSGNISNLLTNATSTSGTVTYIITPTGPATTSCVGTPVNFVVTVNPIPAVTNATLTQAICSGSTATFIPTSGVASTTFAWTASLTSGTVTGFSASGIGNISEILTNTSTTSSGSITYVVIPTGPATTSCVGTPVNFVVTVNPIPTVTNATLTQAICSGSSATFTPTSGVASTTFAWTASLTSGTVTGFSASGTGNISNVLTNSTTTSGTVTYVITPTGPVTTSCVGTPVNFVVTVNPIPTVTNAILTQAICSGSSATFTPTSGVVSTTFAWTASLTSGTVTGFSASGSGNISNVLTNSTTTSGTVTYVITPTGPVTTSCIGTPVNFVVTVNPIPTVTNASLTQAICSGSSATFTPTSGVASSTFGWTASLNSGTVTGFSTSGSGNISNVLTNSTTTSGTVTYVITPTGPATTSCVGTPVNFVVTVSPKPTFTSTFVSPTTCNGTDGTFSLHNLDISTNYTINYSSPSISSSSFTSDGFGDYTVTNLASGAYTFTLTNDLTGCVSSSATTISLLNPGAPVLSITDPSAVCSPTTVDITASSVTSGSSGVVSLSYWNDPGALNSLINPNSISISNTYYIKADNGSCSDIKPVVVLINNKPLVDAPSNITACDSYTLPVLSNGNYYTLTGGNGTALFAGNTISSTQSVYVYASSGTTPNCVSENSFNITINTTPIADSPIDVEVCDDYVLPALTVGNYYSASNGSGLIASGTVLHSTQTLYVYATTNTVPACHSENSFNIIINVTPIVDDIADFNVCDSMKLPIITGSNLSGNEAYYLGQNGANPQYFPGDLVLNSIPVIYIYDSVSNCHSEQSFSVNLGITKDPTFIFNSFCEGSSNGPLAITSPGGSFDFYPAVSNGALIDATTGIISNEVGGSTYPVRYITNGTCPDTLILPIIVNTMPNSPILSNDTTYCFSETIVNMTAIANSGGLISWYSDNSLSNLVGTGLTFMPSANTETYYVTETNTNASPTCESLPSMTTITVQSCEVYVPSAFTPDGDKINDTWELKYLDVNFPLSTVKIFNRWGNIVFESQAGKYELYPWDGKIEGSELPIASYFYVIEHNDGKTETRKGTVTIIKN